MNFYSLKSIVAATKKTYSLKSPSESFCLAPAREKPYIEPTFKKVVDSFTRERPSVILISAVGATGKTALAQVLSNQTQLPLLDLARHKPVADNTLTGLLTSTFDVGQLSDVFSCIKDGSFGVIIDGIDEGRSKQKEEAFEAFLDDIARLCGSSKNTSFVLLGRSRVMEDCWLYLSEKNVNIGLITIEPFNMEGAKRYINTFTGVINPLQNKPYCQTRDKILNILSAAFNQSADDNSKDFFSFIGYPPVLDAIVTLLCEERNYHKLSGEVTGASGSNVEIALLHRIAEYILQREKHEKVLPNIIAPIIKDRPEAWRSDIINTIFEVEEQCMRLIAYCLGKPITLNRIEDTSVNEKYEEALSSWLYEHPFINGCEFRNSVFESMVLASLMMSNNPQSNQLVWEYTERHKKSYHLIYMLNELTINKNVPIDFISIIIGSALEFQSTRSDVDIQIDCPDKAKQIDAPRNDVETCIEILLGDDQEKSKTFKFGSSLAGVSSVNLGHKLSSTFVSLPGEVSIGGNQELECIAPVFISADKVFLKSKSLILRASAQHHDDREIVFEANQMASTLENITKNGAQLTFSIDDIGSLSYPIAQFVRKKESLPDDSLLTEKYLRIKRILMEFRSHSKGALKKYKDKIDHERVLRNDVGKAILKQLLADDILSESESFYCLDPEMINKHLGISWQDLRRGMPSEKLLNYLRLIQ